MPKNNGLNMIFKLLTFLSVLKLLNSEDFPCHCNIIKNYCESGCCCDSDCSFRQFGLFTTCEETSRRDSLQLCKDLISDGFDHPLCIYSINKNVNYTLESAVRLKNILNHSDDFVLYSIGVPTHISYGINEVGPLIIPQLKQTSCEMVSVSFGQSFVSYCEWNVVEIETTNNFRTNNVKCNRLGDVFLMVKNSKMLKDMKLNEINREEIVPIVICYEQNTSLPILCPTTTPNIIINSPNETICSGVPVSVYLKMTYEVIGTISQFEVHALIGSVTGTFTQKYEVEFVQTNASDALPMSGNPGYLIGRPVIGAKINVTDLSSLGYLGNAGSVTTILPTSNMKLSIKGVKQQLSNGVWNILAGGSCGTILQGRGHLVEPIRFGEDVYSGCTLSLSFLEQFTRPEMDWTTRCVQYQNIIWENLLNPIGITNEEDRKGLGINFMSNKPDLLAIWPISKINRSSEWVPIQNLINNNFPTTPRGLNGYCYQLLIGQEIEIQYARFGSMIFPQNQIIGAKCNYIYGDVFFMKPNFNIEITQRVRFTDVTPLAETREKLRPYFLVRLPSDFFYPFA
ncbi:unnamed protein product [Schistosoma guineensis]|nr:unnamed protein product [Schistosoma guineensis]